MNIISVVLATVALADWVNTDIKRVISVHETGTVETQVVFEIERGKLKDNIPFQLHVPNWSSVGRVRIKSGAKALSVGKEVRLDSVIDNMALFSVQNDLVESPIEVSLVAGNVLRPFPEAVMELELQRVVLSEPLLVPSPYSTLRQKTIVQLPSITQGVEQVSPMNKVQVKDNNIIFGPFTDSYSAKGEKLMLHFGLNRPLVYLELVSKVIDISHLGAAVSVKESIDLRNGGAKNSGEFNRVPYTHLKFSGPKTPFTPEHTLFEIGAFLGNTVREIHYRDVIGNISSSNARREGSATRVDIRPRFPLQGGWKSEFDIIYTIPGVDALKQGVEDFSKFALAVPLSHGFSGVFSKSQQVTIVLPSGSSDISVSVKDREITDITIHNEFGWMDTPLLGPESGKRIVSFNLIGGYFATKTESLKPELLVEYTLPQSALYRTPMLLSLYLFVFFSVIIFSRRLNLNITNPKEAEEEKIQNFDFDVCEQIEDQINALSIANATMLESAMSGHGNKVVIEDARRRYVESVEEISTKVGSLCSQFKAERNKTDRTVRIVLQLKTVRDNGISVLDAAMAGKDSMTAATKLVEAEDDVRNSTQKALLGNEATPAPSPSGTSTPGSMQRTSQLLKKRK
jgi:oligosaccharyltransferase complex subunit alpha (ribophorin I)